MRRQSEHRDRPAPRRGRASVLPVSLNDLLTNLGLCNGGGDVTAAKALAARATELALDRPDNGLNTKELCSNGSTHTEASVGRLKHSVRYPPGKRRLVRPVGNQQIRRQLLDSTDTNFAGCLTIRGVSTPGGVARRGRRLIKHWASTQPSMALASGTTEPGGGSARVPPFVWAGLMGRARLEWTGLSTWRPNRQRLSG